MCVSLLKSLCDQITCVLPYIMLISLITDVGDNMNFNSNHKYTDIFVMMGDYHV